ncbi:MAG: hypothetical protein ACXVPU_16785 [Bacteroidia bacterium]
MVNSGREQGLEISHRKGIEGKNALNLDKAKELLKDGTVNDIELEKIIDSLNIFCRISYELFEQEQHRIKQVA